MPPAGGYEGGIRLLLAVARLGEADLFNWWNSRAFGEAGRYVLGGGFPRTWLASALQLAVTSAALRHDEELKRPTALHLFSDLLSWKRLAKHWLAEQKMADRPDTLLERLRDWDRPTACRELAEWAAVKPEAGEAVGAGLRLGSVSAKELDRLECQETVARKLAACYAVLSGPFRCPYFDLTP